MVFYQYLQDCNINGCISQTLVAALASNPTKSALLSSSSRLCCSPPPLHRSMSLHLVRLDVAVVVLVSHSFDASPSCSPRRRCVVLVSQWSFVLSCSLDIFCCSHLLYRSEVLCTSFSPRLPSTFFPLVISSCYLCKCCYISAAVKLRYKGTLINGTKIDTTFSAAYQDRDYAINERVPAFIDGIVEFCFVR